MHPLLINLFLSTKKCFYRLHHMIASLMCGMSHDVFPSFLISMFPLPPSLLFRASSSHDSSALATLTSDEEVLSFSCHGVDDGVHVAGLVQDGSLLLYKFLLSSLSFDSPNAPLAPMSTVQFISTTSKVLC